MQILPKLRRQCSVHRSTSLCAQVRSTSSRRFKQPVHTIVSNAPCECSSRIIAILRPQPGGVPSILLLCTPALYAGILDSINLIQCQNPSTKNLDSLTLISPVVVSTHVLANYREATCLYLLQSLLSEQSTANKAVAGSPESCLIDCQIDSSKLAILPFSQHCSGVSNMCNIQCCSTDQDIHSCCAALHVINWSFMQLMVCMNHSIVKRLLWVGLEQQIFLHRSWYLQDFKRAWLHVRKTVFAQHLLLTSSR